MREHVLKIWMFFRGFRRDKLKSKINLQSQNRTKKCKLIPQTSTKSPFKRYSQIPLAKSLLYLKMTKLFVFPLNIHELLDIFLLMKLSKNG